MTCSIQNGLVSSSQFFDQAFERETVQGDSAGLRVNVEIQRIVGFAQTDISFRSSVAGLHIIIIAGQQGATLSILIGMEI